MGDHADDLFDACLREEEIWDAHFIHKECEQYCQYCEDEDGI